MKKLLMGASLLILMNTPSYSVEIRNQDTQTHHIGFFDSRGTKINNFWIEGKESLNLHLTKMFQDEFKLTGGGKIFIQYWKKNAPIGHAWKNCSIGDKDYIILTKDNAAHLNKLEGVIINMGDPEDLDCRFTFSK